MAKRRFVWVGICLAAGTVLPFALLMIRSRYFSRFCYVNEGAHAAIECLGAAISAFVAFLLYFVYQSKPRAEYIWISSSLLAMSVLSAMHGIATRNGNTFAWFECLYNLVGATFAFGICLPPRFHRLITEQPSARYLPFATIAFSLVIGTASLLSPEHLPTILNGYTFTAQARVLGLISIFFFFSASIRLYQLYLYEGEFALLLLGSLFLLSGDTGFFLNAFRIWGALWWSWHVAQLFGFGIAAGIVLIIFTEMERTIRENENRLRALTGELSASNSQLEKFAYVASHDLQEPLRTMSVYLQLLNRQIADRLQPNEKDYIREALDSARRMREMISGVLSYARLGSQKLVPREVDVNEVLREALNNLRAAIEESHAQVSCGHLPHKLKCDPTQIAQLFQNLLGNALKYRRQGATPAIAIEAISVDQQWQFSVKDNGIGFSPESSKKIFEAFQRLHGVSGQYSGAGIGLATCKQIVERHGGRVWAEGVPNVGAVFFFTIPMT